MAWTTRTPDDTPTTIYRPLPKDPTPCQVRVTRAMRHNGRRVEVNEILVIPRWQAIDYVNHSGRCEFV